MVSLYIVYYKNSANKLGREIGFEIENWLKIEVNEAQY